MREPRPIAGRMPRLLYGRLGIQPPPQPPAVGADADAGTPGIGTDDEHTLMLFEDGSPMQFEDGTDMRFES